MDGESVSPEIEKKEDTFVEDALASSDFYNPVGKLIKGIPGIAEVYSGVENLVGSVFKAGEMAIRENLFAYASSNPAVAAAQNILRTASPIDNKISDALGAMGDFFMESSERTLLNKQKEYGISEEEISRGIVGNVIDGNVGTAAKLTASTVAHQIPQLAAMVATGGTAGAALLGTSAAGNKYAQIQDDPTLSSEEKAMYSLAIGAAEGLAEYMFRTDVSQIRRAFGKKETLEEFKNVLKQQLKKETLLKSTLEEGGEELVVGVVDLLIEDGLRGNFDNWNADAVLELADAALVGGIMGGGVHTVTRGVNALGSSKNERKQSEIKSDINTLNQKKKNATEDQKRVIDELIEEKVGELININTEDSEFYSNFSNEDIKEIISINKDIREASKKYNVAPSETLKKKYADEIKTLRDKKQNIENKYSETPTRYIKDGKELSRTEFVDMLNAATAEELATGQWGVQNDEEVEQLLTSKLPKETQELKVEKTAAEPKTEAEPEILVKNVEDQAINYKDPVSGEIVEGTLLRDGQQAIVETKDKLIEIGNFNEIQDQPISELGIEVQLTPDVKIAGDRVVIRGKEYVSESGNLNEDINYNEEGEVVSISLNTKDGKKRTFRGATAQEFVYQTWLQENASTPEDIAQAENELQELIETDEEARNILTQLTKEPKQVRAVTKDEDTQKVEGEKQQLTDVEYINQYNEDEVAVAEIDTTATAENSRAETERVKQSPIEEEDGTTLNLDGTTYEGDGLVVPFASDDFKSEEITPELIAEFVEKNKNKIPKGAKVVVGLYSFKGEDKVSIDLNVVVDESNLAVATEFARLMGQNSIYRISDGQTVPTGETGDNTVTLMDARARQAAIAITQGKLPQYLKGIRSPSEMAAYQEAVNEANRKALGIKPFSKVNYIKVEDLGKDKRTPERFTDKTVKKLQTMVDNFNKVLKKIGAQPYNITFAANNEQYEARYRELTGKDKSANRGTFIGRKREIIINLSSANEGTLAHEMMHAYLHALNITGKNILQLTNALYTELSTGSAIEKQIARELRKFQDEYIRRNIYGQNKTLEDPNIAEEFLTEYVGIMVQYSERVPASGKVSFAEKIRRAVLKFLTKLGIKDKSILQAIETREEAVNFINGFVNVLSDRAGIETLPTIDVKIQETADPYRAQRSEMEQIEAPAGSRLFNNPLKEATDLSRSYMDSKGLEYKEGKPFNTIDEKQAKRISDAFDAMKDDPTNPEVAAAYKALAEETIDQFEFIIKAGYNVEINNNEPYSSSGEMIEDLRTNKRMKIFSTESGFGDEKITEKQRKENPLLQRTKYKDVNGEPLLVNDLFRFVHDFFGHAKRGNGFGAKGEENAWDVHSRMYSPQARRAMTSETRGQNSYVNFSGINDEAFALRDKARKLRKEGKTEEAAELVGKVYEIMKFADQKVGLLPDEFIENPYDNAPTLQEVSEDGEAVSKEQIDAIKIISLETPRQKAKKDAVADLLNGFSESQLDPNSSEQDLISRFLSNIFEESSYTLKKGARESGMTWYIEDITEFENKMKVLLPELNDPNQMKLFKQVLAITSSGTNPNQNLQTAYTLWVRSNGNAVNFAKNWGEDKISFISKKKKAIGTGIIVRETKTKYIVQKVDALGNLETFKNGQPKLFEARKSELKAGYPKPAGFTSRGSIVAQQLKKIEKIYKDVDGDINKLIEFFEKPQPVSQLRKYNDKVPDVDGNVRKVAVGKRNGAFIFGEKIGAFYQNMIGIGDTITMDLWWSRTWNRYMGTMLSTVKGKEVIQETPRTDRERDIMRKAVTIAAKKLNLDVSELQAVIWYFEQELWTKAGSKSPSFSYVTAVDALNSKIKTDEQTQKRFSEAGADLTAAEKRRQDAIARADNIIAQGGIQGDVDSKEQIDFVNKPLYHGSNKSFDKFDMSKAGATDEGFLGRGVYLTAEYDNAKEYGDIVNVFYADIKNPLIIEDPYSFGGVNPNKIRSTLGLDKNASVSRVTKELKNRGYDAVVVNEIEGTDAIEVAVLDPSIISDKPKTKDVAKEQIDFAGIEMKVKETPGNTDPAIKTGGMAYVPVSRLYNLMDMRDGDRGGLYETARDKKRVAEIVERFKKEGFNSTDGWYQTIYVDIDAGGFGWIGEGNHRVLAARQLGMTHLPVRVEFGAARDGKFIYHKNYSRVPTQVVTEQKIEQLKEQAGKYYHIKYASIWETNLPTNQEPSIVSKEQIDFEGSEMINEFSWTEEVVDPKTGKLKTINRTEKSDKPIGIKFPDGTVALVRSFDTELKEAQQLLKEVKKGTYPYMDEDQVEYKIDLLKKRIKRNDVVVELIDGDMKYHKSGKYGRSAMPMGSIELSNNHYNNYFPKVAKLLGKDHKAGLMYSPDNTRGTDAVEIYDEFQGKGFGSRLYFAALRLLREQVPGARLISNHDFNVKRKAKNFWRSQVNNGLARVIANTATKQEIEQLGGQAVLKQLKDIGAEYTGDIYELLDPTERTAPSKQYDVVEDSKEQIDWQPSLFGRGQVNPAIVNRTTEVQQAAVDLLEGKITNKEYQDTVKFTQTIEAITRFFLPASTKDMKESLDSNKAELLNTPIEDGKEIGLRLDIPAYKNRNIWIVSVHDKGKAGKSISYGSVAWATDVNFGSNPKVAAFIAAGVNTDVAKRLKTRVKKVDGKTTYDVVNTVNNKVLTNKPTIEEANKFIINAQKQDKTTIARMLGKWKNFEGKTKEERDAAAIKKVEEIVAIENKYPGANRTGSPWRQIGMNPFRHSFFYDRRNGKPVVYASEVVQIGGLVYAKDVVYADKTDPMFEVEGYKDAEGETVRFQIDEKTNEAFESRQSIGEKIFGADVDNEVDNQVSQNGSWKSRPRTAFEKFVDLTRLRIQDKFRRLIIVQEDIEHSSGKPVGLDQDFRNAEELMHGKAKEELNKSEEKVAKIAKLN